MDCLHGKREVLRSCVKRLAPGRRLWRIFSRAVLACAGAWHRPSWPVGGFVKGTDPPRLSAEHIGRPPPVYPAGLLP